MIQQGNKGSNAAVMSVFKPGTLVPRATIVMAVIESLMWLIQPKCAATSPMTAVSKPMKKMDPTKAGQPLHLSEQRARRKNKTVSEG